MAVYKSNKNIWILILLLFIGGLAGSAAADALAPYLPFLRSMARIGFDTTTLDLHFVTLALGFKMALSPLTALGLILAYWVYRRL